jgi:hypothetical protein
LFEAVLLRASPAFALTLLAVFGPVGLILLGIGVIHSRRHRSECLRLITTPWLRIQMEISCIVI